MPGEIPNQEDFDEDVAGSVALKRSSALSLADYFPKPAPTSLLWPGQHFRGTQRVTPSGLHGINEDWSVNVTIVSCKYESGTLSGIMEAENVPHTKFPVKTFWEGEIIDNANHVFFTGKWEAWPDTDLVHWSKFSSFEQIKGAVQKQSGRCDALCGYPVIYMRWKEKFFVNCSHECGLTIAGFYYIALDRRTGEIAGFYHDPKSTPYQRLQLAHAPCGSNGHSFVHYSTR
uniref:Glucose-induced degradation protein 4 n=1 Tax=Tetraselmis sp. GSL018 TaxID=582737 RepID=A0A061R7W7_9CHLO|mmetsp:Transcript_3299/g.7750  ORF Transcript_3299/g.7750 Transcript_3299/m.7750 type:complete len:230 (-) Transcript_3299:840-1529(-)